MGWGPGLRRVRTPRPRSIPLSSFSAVAPRVLEAAGLTVPNKVMALFSPTRAEFPESSRTSTLPAWPVESMSPANTGVPGGTACPFREVDAAQTMEPTVSALARSAAEPVEAVTRRVAASRTVVNKRFMFAETEFLRPAESLTWRRRGDLMVTGFSLSTRALSI